MRWHVRISSAVMSAVLFSGVASAHGVGGTRFDAPLPLSLLFVGAGATVGLTAVWLGATGTRLDGVRARRLASLSPKTATALRGVARVAFLVAFVWVLYAGLFGKQVRAENFATVFVWPVWIRGVGLVAVLFGSPWRALSPWLTVYDGLAWLEGTDVSLVGAYPSRLGEWPAVFGFVAGIGIVENLTVIPRSPRLTATVVAAYALVMVAGGLCFGREWFRRADALDVLYRLFGRVAPVAATRDADGGIRFELRAPWHGTTDGVSDLSVTAFVVATVYTVSFDGFTSTSEYQTILFDVREALGVGPVVSVGLYAVGFVGFLVAFALVAATTDRLVGNSESWRTTACAFAPTVLPIAVAYELAHNYPYVLRNAGQLAAVLGPYLGSATDAIEPLWWLSLPAFWWSQILLIVGGHVVAVVASHEVARRRYATRSLARRAHLPLTALMIGYTVLSLWIVSRPVVAG
ncbi:hypothetical protein [Halostella sp. PRR32]|uniref:hypothetical protein n=1 Tax=Halostella sp. PRR32 TaxID=3098147 RepID=UPI002B1D3585|nr:hypothetical protein [Halostella sp. PRR32]